MSDLLTRVEAAAVLRVHPTTLRRWRRQGKLPVVRLSDGTIRYRQSDLDALVTASLRWEGDAPPKRAPRPIQSAPSWADPDAINAITGRPNRETAAR